MRFQSLLLTGARVRANFLGLFTVVWAIAIATLSILSVQGITYSTGNSLVTYSLNKLPAGEANITINSSQIINSQSTYDEISTYLSKYLGGVTKSSLTREVIFNQLSDLHGIRFYLGASQDLQSSLTLRSGKLPAPCTPQFCEVIQVGQSAGGVPRPDALGLHIVGTGTISNPLLFSGTVSPTAGNSILIANGINSLASLPAFRSSHAADAWVGKIDLDSIKAKGADAYIAKVVAFEDQLSIDYPDLIVTWPQDALGAASDDAASFKQKTVLLNFAIVTLLLGFLSIVSFRQRKDHLRFRESLSRIGTPKSVINQELFFESALPVKVGVLIGLLFSPLLPPLLSLFGYDTGFTQLFPGTINLVAVALTAFALLFSITLVGERAWKRERIGFFALAALSFAGYLYLTHVSDTRYLLLPFVYLGVPALGVIIGLRFITSLWVKRGRETFIVLKEFSTLWQGVAATIALATLLAMATLSFGSGVSAQAISSAHDLVPLDVALKTGSNLVKPLDLAGVDGYSKLVSGSSAYGVLRTGTSVRGQGAVSDSLSLIGLPSEAVSSLVPSAESIIKSTAFAGTSNQYGLKVGKTKSLNCIVNILSIGINFILCLQGKSF